MDLQLFFRIKKNISENHEIIKQMCETINHRGPDDEGYLDNKIGYLGHKRLKIIDLARGKQPMQTSCGRYNLIFNGEIYNYLELKKNILINLKLIFTQNLIRKF